MLAALLALTASNTIDTSPRPYDLTQDAYVSALESRLSTAEFWSIPEIFKAATQAAQELRVTLIATNTPRDTNTPNPTITSTRTSPPTWTTMPDDTPPPSFTPSWTPTWTPEFVIVPPTPTRENLQATAITERCFLIIALAGQSVRDEPNGTRLAFGANYGTYVRVRDSEFKSGYEWAYSPALGGWLAVSIAESRPLGACE